MGSLRPFHGSPKSEGKDGVGSLPRINTIIATFTLLHVLRWPIYQLTMVSFVFVQSVWSCSDKMACWWKFHTLFGFILYWYTVPFKFTSKYRRWFGSRSTIMDKSYLTSLLVILLINLLNNSCPWLYVSNCWHTGLFHPYFFKIMYWRSRKELQFFKKTVSRIKLCQFFPKS